MCFISVYSVLNTLSEYTYIDIPKKHYFMHTPFWLFLKSSKVFSISLRHNYFIILSIKPGGEFFTFSKLSSKLIVVHHLWSLKSPFYLHRYAWKSCNSGGYWKSFFPSKYILQKINIPYKKLLYWTSLQKTFL